MKKFFINFLAFIILLTGHICGSFYQTEEGFYWYHVVLFLGYMLILQPAFVWWHKYICEVFEIKDEK